MPLPSAAFADLFSVTRAGPATVVGSDGNVADVAANAPRFDFTAAGVPNGLLIEGAQTNLMTNPRFAGGSVGVLPTGVSFGTTNNGITVTNLGTETIGGVEFYVVRYSGTATAIAGNNYNLGGTVAYTVAEQLDTLFRIYLKAGSMSGFTLFRFGQGSLGATADLRTLLNSTPTDYRATKAAGAGGSDGTVQPFLGWTTSNGATIDATISFGMPRMYAGGRINQSFVRPATAVTGTSTRARDAISFTRVDWWNPDREVTGDNVGSSFMLQCMLPALTTATDRGILRIDDGTASNRFEIYNPAGTSNIVMRRVISGSATTTTIGTYTADAPFRIVISAVSATITALVTGGDIVTASTGGTFSPARAFLGSVTTDDTTPMWGYVYGGLFYPYAQTNIVALQMSSMSIPFATLRAEGGA